MLDQRLHKNDGVSKTVVVGLGPERMSQKCVNKVNSKE